MVQWRLDKAILRWQISEAYKLKCDIKYDYSRKIMAPFKLSKKKYHYGIRKPGVILLGKDLKPVFLSYSAGVVLCQNIRIRNWNTVLEVWINGQNYISSPKRVDNLQNNNKKKCYKLRNSNSVVDRKDTVHLLIFFKCLMADINSFWVSIFNLNACTHSHTHIHAHTQLPGYYSGIEISFLKQTDILSVYVW